MLVYLWLSWIFADALGLSLAVESGGCSSGDHRLLVVEAPLVAECRRSRRRSGFSSRGSQAPEHRLSRGGVPA